MTADATPPAAVAAPPPSDTPWVPFWLVRLGAIGWRVLVVAALALVLLGIAWVIGTVTASVVLALVLSAAFAPLVIRLRAKGWARTRAAVAGTLAAVAIGGVLLLVAAGVLIRYGPDLVAAVASGLQALNVQLANGSVPPEIGDFLTDLGTSLKEWIAARVSDVVGTLATVFTVLLFGTFTTFFLLQDGDHAWAWAMQGASERRRAAATVSGARGLAQVGGYLRTVAALAAVEAVVDGALLVLFGVPNALPLATLVFVGGFIPYLGGLVATSVVLLAALASIGPEATMLLLVLIVVANVIEDRYVARVARLEAVRIHPAVILVALPIGAVAAGLFGLVMAGPVAAFLLASVGSITDAVRPDPMDAPKPDGEADDGPPIVPDWLEVLAQWSWRLLIGIGLVGLAVLAIVQVPAVLMPLIIATVLASTFAPLTRALRRRGWGTSVSAGVVTAGVYLGIAAILGLTVAALLRNASEVSDDASEGAGSIAEWLGSLGTTLQGLVDALGAGLVGIAGSVLVEIVGLAASIVLGAILTFFFLRDGAAAWAVVTGWMAPWRRREADAAAERAVGVLGGYMIGTGTISAFGAATQFVIMVVLGIPLALPLAVLSFFGGFIPYIGSLVTTGLALLVTIAVGDTTDIIVMTIFTLVFNIVQGNIVAPLVYSRAVSIHPAIVLLAIPAGSAVAGVIGMFLVVPFLGVVATTWRTVLVVMGEPPPAAGPVASEAATAAPTGEVEGLERRMADGAVDG